MSLDGLDEDVPETCPACGEDFPSLTLVFSHHCEGLARTRRHRPPLVLPVRKHVVEWVEKQPGSRWGRRLVNLGIRIAVGRDGDFAQVLDRMSPRYAYRIKERIKRDTERLHQRAGGDPA